MEKIDIIEHGVLEEICQLVGFTTTESLLKFRILVDDGPRFKPYLLGLIDLFPDIKYATHGSWFHFGACSPEIDDKIADLFYVKNYVFSEDYGKDAISESDQSNIVFEYPWEKLVKIGDHFFVPNGDKNVLAVMSSHKSRLTSKVYRTHTINGGVLVMLINCLEPEYQFKVIKDQ